jgi:hypothetical protein
MNYDIRAACLQACNLDRCVAGHLQDVRVRLETCLICSRLLPDFRTVLESHAHRNLPSIVNGASEANTSVCEILHGYLKTTGLKDSPSSPLFPTTVGKIRELGPEG